jgi:predicted aspartyl protease
MMVWRRPIDCEDREEMTMITETAFRLTGEFQPLLLVSAHVNDNGPFTFILDTGAGTCLLTPELAERLGIEITGSQQAAGAGGQVKVQTGRLRSLTVGAATVPDVHVAVTPEIHRIAAAVGASIDGDLGYSFLKNFRVSLDYRRSILRLETPDEAVSSAGPALPFTLASPMKPLVLIEAHINGRGPFLMALDTGTSTTVLSPRMANDLGLALRPAPPMTGGGGMIDTRIGVVSALRLGAAERQNLQVMVADFLDMLSRMTGAPLDGIVGHNFLKHFCVTIDYPASLLSFAQVPYQKSC